MQAKMIIEAFSPKEKSVQSSEWIHPIYIVYLKIDKYFICFEAE